MSPRSTVSPYPPSLLTPFVEHEPNLLKVKEPVIIIGDIHGQYYDMIHMFEKVVDPRGLPGTNLLFLGDYVDRGIFSLEVLVYLYALKVSRHGPSQPS